MKEKTLINLLNISKNVAETYEQNQLVIVRLSRVYKKLNKQLGGKNK